jgi:topoisomerase IV subunit A
MFAYNEGMTIPTPHETPFNPFSENGLEDHPTTALKRLMDSNFMEYASYVIKDRAIPFLEDGLKPVQRRILHTLHEVDDGKFHKVANIVGHTMRYHPHGDASIEAALVNMAQKMYLIEQQGNFGNPLTGDPASAARYIECRLSDLAREGLFQPEITEYADSYDGRNKEPVVLPSKLPLLLMTGVEGIAVGLSTRILPHNFIELLEAQIAILKHEDYTIYPDFLQGGLLDVSQYQKGMGRLRIRARIEVKDPRTLVIREVPFGTNTESLIGSIEAAAHKGKLKIASINDFTTEEVEIEVRTRQGADAHELLPQLYLYTDCENPVSVNAIVIRDQHPVEMNVNQILEANTALLENVLQRELQVLLDKLRRKYRDLMLVQIFIENKIYQALEEADDLDVLKVMLRNTLEPMLDEQFIPIPEESIDKLLNIPIRRISRFDSNKANEELGKIADHMQETRKKLARMTEVTIEYLEALIKKYKFKYPRRTMISSFDTVDIAEVAVQDIKVGFDAENSYVGSDIRSEQPILCSSFDKLLFFFKDGGYRVIDIPEKLFIEEKVLALDRQNNLPEVSVIYKDHEEIYYMKRFQVSKFILNKDYRFIPEDAKLLFFSTEPEPLVQLIFKPKARTRVSEQLVDFSKMRLKSVSSKGNKVTDREIKTYRVKARSPVN